MRDSRFDRWTRRRFGLTTGGVLAAALGLAAFDAAQARRKKRRKKRCRKNHQTCTPPGSPVSKNKKLRCCKGLSCNDETNDPEVGACCRYFQVACETDSQCCSFANCQQAIGLQGKRCCAPLGISCEDHSDCCAGNGVICHPTIHDCCREVQASCAASDECCGELQCSTVPALGGLRCCAADGDSCQETNDCCGGIDCIDGTCRAGSDRAIKANFGSVDGQDMLARVRDLPIATWNYTSDAPHVRHIGPMAQDFAALFGVGSDDRHIHPIDGQGVALAAIQGLVTELERVRQVNGTLAERVAALENARGGRAPARVRKGPRP